MKNEPQVSEFLESKLGDDIFDERGEIGLLDPDRWRAALGEVRFEAVDAAAKSAPREEVGFQVLQIQRELQKIDVQLWESSAGAASEEEEGD